MAPLTSEVITHVVPSSVIPHPNSPWTALKSAPKSPYLITSDPFGAATHIWSISDRGFKHVRSLDPPLPGGLIRVSLGLTSEPGVIVLAYDKPNQSAGVLRVYDIDRDGKMTHEVVTPSDLPSGSIDQVFKSTGEFVAVSLDGEDKIAILYKLEDRTLKEVFRVTIPDATGVESLLILHILADGSLLTGRTTGPSFNLDLSLHRLSASETEPIRCTLPPVNKECDYVDPSYVLPLSDSLIILAVKESSSEDDYHPYTTTSSVHFISLPSLTVTASIPFPHSVTRLVHSPSLGVVIALGARLGHGVDSDRVPIVTFLDANTGTQKHQVELPRSTAIVRCTTDKLVVVYKTGLVSHTPLQDVIAGQEISEAQAVTTRPEPYNARARKAGEAWTWVDHVFVAGEGVVLFESRGIDMHFVKF